MARKKKIVNDSIDEYLGVESYIESCKNDVKLYLDISVVSVVESNGSRSIRLLTIGDLQELSSNYMRKMFGSTFWFGVSNKTFCVGGKNISMNLSQLYKWACHYGSNRHLPKCDVREGFLPPDDDKVWLQVLSNHGGKSTFVNNMDVLLCKDFYKSLPGRNKKVNSAYIVQNGLRLFEVNF